MYGAGVHNARVHYASGELVPLCFPCASCKADGIETLCSALIKNPEDQQVQVQKSWRFAGVKETGVKWTYKNRPEVFQKNTFTLMKAGYGVMKLSF